MVVVLETLGGSSGTECYFVQLFQICMTFPRFINFIFGVLGFSWNLQFARNPLCREIHELEALLLILEPNRAPLQFENFIWQSIKLLKLKSCVDSTQ